MFFFLFSDEIQALNGSQNTIRLPPAQKAQASKNHLQIDQTYTNPLPCSHRIQKISQQTKETASHSKMVQKDFIQASTEEIPCHSSEKTLISHEIGVTSSHENSSEKIQRNKQCNAFNKSHGERIFGSQKTKETKVLQRVNDFGGDLRESMEDYQEKMGTKSCDRNSKEFSRFFSEKKQKKRSQSYQKIQVFF